MPGTQSILPNIWGSIFNNNLQPVDSIPATKWHKETDLQFRSRHQNNPYTPHSFSGTKSVIQLSAQAQASGAIGNGTTLNFNTTLTPNPPHAFEMNFAIPYVGIYWNTPGNGPLQIWPQLGTIPGTAFRVTAGYDFQLFSIGTPGSVIASFSGNITDNSMGNGTIFLVTQWQYFNYNQGTSIQG